jgi:hypothetical protein
MTKLSTMVLSQLDTANTTIEDRATIATSGSAVVERQHVNNSQRGAMGDIQSSWLSNSVGTWLRRRRTASTAPLIDQLPNAERVTHSSHFVC